VHRQVEEGVGAARPEAHRDVIRAVLGVVHQPSVLNARQPGPPVDVGELALTVADDALQRAEIDHQLDRAVGQHRLGAEVSVAAHAPDGLHERGQLRARAEGEELEAHGAQRPVVNV
jgi:hypothetical protein